MLRNTELTGELLDYQIVNLILQLRDVTQSHKIGSTHIEVNDASYDARLIYKALQDLEKIAKESNLEIKPITADSSLDELLGNVEAKNVTVKTTLDCWQLLEQIAEK
ncbi:hypothetical protein [Polynucleobacter sp. 80A-SIGWE]|uniref:hypothetical protein n=1 Tax=Polynucleobacter sp. 80A-SIGWE TaxID=2689100 RepID=UPI001C0DF871|nr:hypothetical protein [Polynucleobacter sp. 80A-SIGWE]MBU3588524.1 hypothetical protein [Polynucleobacter sp. 80A-SIGWE]